MVCIIAKVGITNTQISKSLGSGWLYWIMYFRSGGLGGGGGSGGGVGMYYRFKVINI